MALRTIIQSPNEILSTRSIEVENPASAEVKNIIQDMKDTVIAKNGVGLAAPQIGIGKRIIAINVGDKPYVIINPIIEWKSGGITPLEEGCLSVPDYFVKISRPKKVVVSGLNENGEKIEVRGKDLLAKVLQHEIDHIDGILILDRAKEI